MPKSALPPYVSLKTITSRLPEIFPDGTINRNYLIREISAKTIFVMLYTGAEEGQDRWLRPNQVARMTDQQAAQRNQACRVSWTAASLRPQKQTIPGRWYADNTREPIRDETLRSGLILAGAVVEREGLATTSALPRYALTPAFAELFLCSQKTFPGLARKWRQAHLTVGALARLQLVKKGVGRDSGKGQVLVTFPSGEIRRMSPGPSSRVSKAVIEEFTLRFMKDPGVVFLSESRNKVISRDDELAQAIGLNIDAAKVLPDIVLVDLAPKHPLLVFVEVVATAGPVSEQRKMALFSVAQGAGFKAKDVAFVTALLDKEAEGIFRRVSGDIAWGSFVWFASEPQHILHYHGSGSRVSYLYDLHGKSL